MIEFVDGSFVGIFGKFVVKVMVVNESVFFEVLLRCIFVVIGFF